MKGLRAGHVVAMSKDVESPLWTVLATSGFQIKLGLPTDQDNDGPQAMETIWVDRSLCRKPTKAQLDANFA